tara:strand:+ start:822 stop:1277 length:456 start_codon:yes stop_codon:yes gene_type:complete
MDIDEILINLKVLENLEANQKLISRGPYLNIEFQSIIPEWVRRWRRQDSRNETLKKINLVVNSAINYCEDYKTTIVDNGEKNRLKDVIDYLIKAINGLISLKETYATCHQTVARIDVIINKIELATNIKKISNIKIESFTTSNLKTNVKIE